MAKQVIGVGTNANDGTGDPIRDAFVKVNSNFDELYTDDAGDVGSIIATAPIVRDQATGNVTISLANSGVTYAKMQNLATANRLLGSTSTGVIGETQVVAAMMAANSVNSDNYVDGSIDTIHVANDQITPEKLGIAYTASAALTEGTDVTVNCASADVFTLTPAGNNASTLDFTNVVIGMTKSIIVTGAGGENTIAFDDINGSNGTFNVISGTYSDAGSAKNLIQLKFISTSEAWITISQIAS